MRIAKKGRTNNFQPNVDLWNAAELILGVKEQYLSLKSENTDVDEPNAIKEVSSAKMTNFKQVVEESGH